MPHPTTTWPSRFALFVVALSVAIFSAACSSDDSVGPRLGPEDTVGLPDRTTGAPPDTVEGGPPQAGGGPAPWESGGDGSELSPLCAAAKRIRAFDLQSDSAFAAAESASSLEFAESAFAEGIAELSALLPDLTQAWDEVAAAAPDLSADAVVVRDGTVDLTAIMVSTPLLDLSDAIETQFGLQRTREMADAILRIDAITRSECDIVLAD